jgi:hypothetical protein
LKDAKVRPFSRFTHNSSFINTLEEGESGQLPKKGRRGSYRRRGEGAATEGGEKGQLPKEGRRGNYRRRGEGATTEGGEKGQLPKKGRTGRPSSLGPGFYASSPIFSA